MTGEQGEILVVDDEENIRNLVQGTLEGAGYNVDPAANGQEALDKLPRLKVELVLLDIKMPGMSGMEVLEQIATNRPDICVVMETQVGDAQTAVEAMKLGAHDHITKPFNRDNVVLKVRRAIKERVMSYLVCKSEVA